MQKFTEVERKTTTAFGWVAPVNCWASDLLTDGFQTKTVDCCNNDDRYRVCAGWSHLRASGPQREGKERQLCNRLEYEGHGVYSKLPVCICEKENGFSSWLKMGFFFFPPLKTKQSWPISCMSKKILSWWFLGGFKVKTLKVKTYVPLYIGNKNKAC